MSVPPHPHDGVPSSRNTDGDSPNVVPVSSADDSGAAVFGAGPLNTPESAAVPSDEGGPEEPANARRRKPSPTVVVIIVIALCAAGVLVYFASDGSLKTFSDKATLDDSARRLTAKEFYASDPWQSRLKDVHTHADRVNMADLANCTEAGDITDTLVKAGCQYGIDGIYEREDLHLTLYERVFVFSDRQSAVAAAKHISPETAPGKVEFSVDVPDGIQYGGQVDTAGKYLVITVAALDTEHSKDYAEQTFGHFHADHVRALLWT